MNISTEYKKNIIETFFPYNSVVIKNTDTLTAWWVIFTFLYFIISFGVLFYKIYKIQKPLKALNNNFSLEEAKKIEFLKVDFEHYEKSFINYGQISKTTLSAEKQFKKSLANILE